MFSCKRASQLISEAMDRKLSLRERVALRGHLLICGFCRSYRRQLALIRQALRHDVQMAEDAASLTDVKLSPDARKRIERAIGNLP